MANLLGSLSKLLGGAGNALTQVQTKVGGPIQNFLDRSPINPGGGTPPALTSPNRNGSYIGGEPAARTDPRSPYYQPRFGGGPATPSVKMLALHQLMQGVQNMRPLPMMPQLKVQPPQQWGQFTGVQPYQFNSLSNATSPLDQDTQAIDPMLLNRLRRF